VLRCTHCGACTSVPPDAPLVGRVIGGHHLVRKVGAGGMGTVYLATQISLRRNVAFKALKGELLRDAQALEQFRLEAISAARLSHPNIVQIYDVASDQGVPYITMEFVNGVSLRTLLKAGPLSVIEAVDLARQVLTALSRAHREKIVHRDIKPENILIDRDGLAKVADFGLAAILRAGGKAEDIRRGSPSYMSPEHARGEPVDFRTDIYSVGATLYHMLTGRPPFDGGSPREVLAKVQSETPLPVAAFNESIPDRLSAVVDRMMARDRTDRYASADEALDALADAQVAGEDLAAEAQAFATPEWDDAFQGAELDMWGDEGPPRLEPPRSGKGRRLLIPLASGILFVVVAALAVVVVLRQRAPAPPTRRPTVRVIKRTDPKVAAQAAGLLEKAEVFESRNPEQYAALIERLERIVRDAPDTEAGRRAAQKAAVVRRALDAKAEPLLEALSRKAEAFAKEGAYEKAQEVFAEFPLEYLDSRWRRRVHAAEAKLREAARLARATLSRKARQALETNDFEAAKRSYEQLARVGGYQASVEAEEGLERVRILSACHAEAQRLAAEVAYVRLAKGVTDLTVVRAYGEALAKCDEALKNPAMAPVRQKVAAEKQRVQRAAAFFRAAVAQLARRPGTLIKAQGRVGRLRMVRGDVVVIELGDAEVNLRTAELDTNTLIRVLPERSAGPPGKDHLERALFYMYENLHTLARIELGKAARLGAEVTPDLRARVEMMADEWKRAGHEEAAALTFVHLRAAAAREDLPRARQLLAQLKGSYADSRAFRDHRQEVDRISQEIGVAEETDAP